jgi:hypothetical protein
MSARSVRVPRSSWIIAVAALAGWEFAVRRIIQANIDKFKLLLKDETDPTKRVVVRRLLDEEEVKLKDLTEHKNQRKEGLLAHLAPRSPMRWCNVDRLFR